MKSIVMVLLGLFMAIYCPAQQSITPSVNNLAGLETKISNTLVSASIGEPAVTTLISSNGIITQGFLQPEILPCVNVEFRYYPNPVKDIMTIEALGCEAKIETVEVIDLWGRSLVTGALNKKNEMNLSELSQGMYFLKVKLTNETVYTVNIIKAAY